MILPANWIKVSRKWIYQSLQQDHALNRCLEIYNFQEIPTLTTVVETLPGVGSRECPPNKTKP